ncbi:MAG: polyphosphate kinase [Mycobacterium sp.]|jgi:hypothetical protein|nr:polyphosphate kinase [Mycobacterium sp.]
MTDIDMESLTTSQHGYTVEDDHDPVFLDRDGNPVDTWRERYPYVEWMPRAEYQRVKRRLQIELLKLQPSISIRAARGWWRWKSRPIARNRSGISSATCRTFPPPARWFCSTGRGTTTRAWRRRWDSAHPNIPALVSACLRTAPSRIAVGCVVGSLLATTAFAPAGGIRRLAVVHGRIAARR